jgi:hypothetical protein
MPIGVLTLHTGHNEGAMLQALALTWLLEEVTGEPAEIVDHRYAGLHARACGAADTPRKQAIEAFGDRRLPLSPQRFDDDHDATWQYIAERYGAVIIGSDEVWKVHYRPRLRGLLHFQDDPFSPPYPNVYWPDARAGSVRIAYAATAGTKTDWRRIPGRRRREMADAINGFRMLGLRDARTKSFIEWISQDAADRSVRVPDPTIAANVLGRTDPNGVRVKLEELGADFGRRRAAVIANPNPALSGMLSGLAREGVQTVAISYANRAAELDLSAAGLDPLEWAAALEHFDLVISERMHGCIFALLNGTPVLAIDSRQRSLGLATKNEELIDRFELSEILFPIHDDERTTAQTMLAAANRILSGDWPSETVARKIEDERRIAREFLHEAFGKKMPFARRPTG